jgi:uncharacterized protein YndB with AHSA1/START domain
MMAQKETIFNKDVANKRITVVRNFDAPVEEVWKAWTESNLLDQWWAPKPWKAETSSMDFREGGAWLYAMVGPNGEKHHARVDYKKIEANQSFTAQDAFTDESGKVSGEMPSMTWYTTFHKSGDGTRVEVQISFPSEDAMNKILEMGFKEGFEAALGNLDALLAGK